MIVPFCKLFAIKIDSTPDSNVWIALSILGIIPPVIILFSIFVFASLIVRVASVLSFSITPGTQSYILIFRLLVS